LALTVDRDTPYFRNNGNLSTAYSYVMAERGVVSIYRSEFRKPIHYTSPLNLHS